MNASSARKRRWAKALALAALAAAPALAPANDVYWAKSTGGDFNLPGNWTGGMAPGKFDTAFFNLSSTYSVGFPASAQTNWLDIKAGDVTFFVKGITPQTYSLIGKATVNGGNLTLDSFTPMTLSVGDVLYVMGSNQVRVKNASDLSAATLNLGSGSDGTLLIDGSGSSLTTTSASQSYFGQAGTTGTLIFQNAATGTLAGTMGLADSGANNSTGSITVQSGATVSGNAAGVNLKMGTRGLAGQRGTLRVLDQDSSFTQNGAGWITLGAASGSTGTIEVEGGTFTSGTGLTTINATGAIEVGLGGSFSTYIANGDITVDGGSFRAGYYGQVNWASGRTLTLKNGGQFNIANGSFDLPVNSRTTIEANSQLTAGYMHMADGAQVAVKAGGTLASAYLTVATGAAGGLSIDGTDAYLTANDVTIGLQKDGVLTLKNGALGAIGSELWVGAWGDQTPVTGTLRLESGSTLTTQTLVVGNASSWSSTLSAAGFVTIGQDASLEVQSTRWDAVKIGSKDGSASRVDVEEGGTFISHGAIRMSPGAVLSAAGRFEQDGSINMYGATLDVSGYFAWGQGHTLHVEQGSKATFRALGIRGETGQTINVRGLGSRLVVSEGDFGMGYSGSHLNVTGGATAQLPRLYMEGGTITVDGIGSSLTVSDDYIDRSWIGMHDQQAVITFSNGATGQFADEVLVSALAGGNGTLNVLSGSTVTFSNNLWIAGESTGGQGAVTVSGAGATINVLGEGGTVIGNEYDNFGTLTIEKGGTFNAGPGGITLNPKGSIIIDGGIANLGTVTRNGYGQIDFKSGRVSLAGPLNVGFNGLLGETLDLSAGKALSVAGAVTVDANQSLVLSGGSLSAESIVNNGTFAFGAGRLELTGTAGLSIGSDGLLGATPTLGAGQTLSIAGMTRINSGAVLSANAGSSFSTGSLMNSGYLFLNTPSVAVTSTFNNLPSGRLQIGRDTPVSIAAFISNDGQIQLNGGLATLGGAGSIENRGLILGDGEVAKYLTNSGEIRVSTGQRLLFSGYSQWGIDNLNSGKISLLGGTAEFRTALTNAPLGRITGRGTFIAAGGLTNQGQIQLSAGLSDFFGPITSTSGSKIIVSGQGTATFYDNVTLNSGSEFRVGADSRAVFFGNVSGTINFTGSGVKSFEAGSSTLAAMATAGSTVVEEEASLSVGYVREEGLSISGNVALQRDSAASRVNLLSMGDEFSPGRLDLANNTLVVQKAQGDGLSDLDAISAWIGAGRIISSEAANDPAMGLAAIANRREGGGRLYASFDGLAVDAESILIAYTRNGDTDLNGIIDATDYFHVARGQAKGLTGYAAGDFDYSGGIDLGDYSLIDRSFLAQRGKGAGRLAATTAVPEPGGLLAGAAAGLLLAARRRRTLRR